MRAIASWRNYRFYILNLLFYLKGETKPSIKLGLNLPPHKFWNWLQGASARGMELSHTSGITFVESDLPGIVTQKQKLIEQLVGQRDNLHFVPLDVTQNPSQFPQTL